MRPDVASALKQAAATIAVAVSLLFALVRLGPESPLIIPYNSDGSIPILMSNDPVFDPFRLYFYSQDRFGALPFLLGARAAQWFDFWWTPELLSVYRTCWLFMGVFFLLRLGRSLAALVAVAFAIAAVLAPGVRLGFFGLDQIYPWSIPPLFLAWWLIRRMVERPGSKARRAAVVLAVFAATWISSSNGPVLLGVGLLEFWDRRRRGGATEPDPEMRPGPGFLRRLGIGTLLTVAFGVGLELVVRLVYYLYNRSVFGHAFRTKLRLDIGFLRENLNSVVESMLRSPLAVVLCAGALFGMAALTWIVWRGLVAPKAHRGEGERTVRADTLVLSAASAWMAFSQLGLLVLVSHFRENQFHPRYFAPIELGLLLSAICGGLWAMERTPATVREWAFAFLGILGFGAVVYGFVFPERVATPVPASPQPTLAQYRTRALALSGLEPGTLLLGDYWDVYASAALIVGERVRPLVREGQYLRTPWLIRELRVGTPVVVLSRPDRVDPPHLQQYGRVLKATGARTMEVAGLRLKRYRVVAK